MKEKMPDLISNVFENLTKMKDLIWKNHLLIIEKCFIQKNESEFEKEEELDTSKHIRLLAAKLYHRLYCQYLLPSTLHMLEEPDHLLKSCPPEPLIFADGEADGVASSSLSSSSSSSSSTTQQKYHTVATQTSEDIIKGCCGLLNLPGTNMHHDDWRLDIVRAMLPAVKFYTESSVIQKQQPQQRTDPLCSAIDISGDSSVESSDIEMEKVVYADNELEMTVKEKQPVKKRRHKQKKRRGPKRQPW